MWWSLDTFYKITSLLFYDLYLKAYCYYQYVLYKLYGKVITHIIILSFAIIKLCIFNNKGKIVFYWHYYYYFIVVIQC